MEDIASNATKAVENATTAFKKPVIIGKIGRIPRKIIPIKILSTEDNNPDEASLDSNVEKMEVELVAANVLDLSTSSNPEAAKDSLHEQSTKDLPLSYVEPIWSGSPVSNSDYKFEVLKCGVIIETLNLMNKSFWVFGRLPTCDIYQQHPTISRYHVVLQYKVDNSSDRPKGFYIYDLGSTHGTFLNKNRIKPKIYVRIQVGHMLKLGCSTRTFFLVGPDDDAESESALSVTELRLKRAEELKERELKDLREAQEREERKRKEDERGIDWGMGEDADEETDLVVNPYAETNNEELYLDDPKKTLRGFMEREGHELHYEVTERGVGQFLCSVVLPVDDARGRSIVAEALVKGKKKEAVIQCALEACRILDRHGVLRQATHESKKRKAKNWEENDYYDSDEDTFLDRTGTIERKREKRMKAKQTQQPETYQSLCAKEEILNAEIMDIEKQLNDTSQAGTSRLACELNEADSLDQYMNELTSNKSDKYKTAKLKNELNRLRKEHADVVRLLNIARPAHLPPLVTFTSAAQEGASTSGAGRQKKALPMFGKRLKVKVMLPSREIPSQVNLKAADDDEADDESSNSILQEAIPTPKAASPTPKRATPAPKRATPTPKAADPTPEAADSTSEAADSTSEAADSTSEAVDSTSEAVDSAWEAADSGSEVGAAAYTSEERQRESEEATSNQEEENVEITATRKGIIKQLEIKMTSCDEKALASLDNKVKAKISKTVTKLRKIAEEEERIVVDEKRLAVQKKKIFEQLNTTDSKNVEKHMKLTNALSKMTNEICTIGDRKLKIVEKINKLADDINNIAIEIRAASKLQHEKAVNRMKEFVEKAHKQQTEIFGELSKIGESVADQHVLDKLKELYEWLTSQKVQMLDNLERLKNVKITEDAKLMEDIIEFEVKSDNFITTILDEIRKIRENNERSEASSSKRLKIDDSASTSDLQDNDSNDDEAYTSVDSEKRKKKNLRRIAQRQEKAELERKQQYEEDALKEDYNMWVPPEGQTGDGRTSLNDKLGY